MCSLWLLVQPLTLSLTFWNWERRLVGHSDTFFDKIYFSVWPQNMASRICRNTWSMLCRMSWVAAWDLMRGRPDRAVMPRGQPEWCHDPSHGEKVTGGHLAMTQIAALAGPTKTGFKSFIAFYSHGNYCRRPGPPSSSRSGHCGPGWPHPKFSQQAMALYFIIKFNLKLNSALPVLL